MYVSSIGGSPSAAASSTTQTSQRIQSIERQISELQRKIQETQKNDNLDSQSKQEQIAEYRQQMLLLQQEKMQAQNEEARQQRDNRSAQAEDPARTSREQYDTVEIDKSTQNMLLRAEAQKQTGHALRGVQESLKSELRKAESNAFKPNAAPPVDYVDTADLRARVDSMDGMLIRQGKVERDADQEAEIAAKRQDDRQEEDTPLSPATEE